MKKPNASAAAAVAILPDDLLGDALARLPDLPSLASAALVSKRWRRVASDPAILRRFHPFRRPPLVGVILSDRGDMPFPGRCPNLRFVPAHTREPRLVAAAGAGDFLFGGIPDDCSGENNAGGRRRDDKWRLRGCDGGLLLSRGGDSRDLAVYDPFARTAVLFAPPDALRPWCHVAHYALVADDTDASFRVIAARFCSELKAAVFSSRSRDWVPVPSAGVEVEGSVGVDGVRAGRFVHWRSDVSKSLYYIDEEEIVVLDTDTMRWSVIDAPFAAGEPYCVADVAEHGGLCLVSSSKEQLVRLWVRESDEWVIKKEVSLLKVYGFLKKIRREEWMKRVRPLAMRGDYVLMEFWSIRRSHSYLLMLNLKTMKLDMFRNDAAQPYRGPAYPFFMPSASPRIDQRTVMFKVLD